MDFDMPDGCGISEPGRRRIQADAVLHFNIVQEAGIWKAQDENVQNG
jgi:hypothetical protein